MRLLISLFFLPCFLNAQDMELSGNWQFRRQGGKHWHTATVPGTIYTDLLKNKLIPDPFYRDNETKVQWVDSANWEYKTSFDAGDAIYSSHASELVFDGLDTYADVYLNGRLVLQADNMFRQWRAPVKKWLRKKNNTLTVVFFSAQKKTDSIARSRLPLVLPDNNRVYARKAQYQFGWDWGPKLTGCGIWKKVMVTATNRGAVKRHGRSRPFAKLVQTPDTIGTSFYFEKEGKPVYIKGANWIPADIFLPRVKKEDYRKLLQSAKDANMNMLRVWGGGVYEADEFYDLCDSLGIMVWQDLMFAGGMYPGDDAFFANVKEEVSYQVSRLRSHPCVVLWCGNNEIDEAWNNWGWQNQFNLHGSDSAKVWKDYQRLFRDSLKKWVDEFDGYRPYISTSPKIGWGHAESLTEGDSHYWGVWWGLQDWEVFENKTGRFVSEYGMQSMPNFETVKNFTGSAGEQYLYSPSLKAHQKASEGFKKLNHYLNRYFIDTNKLDKLSLEDYTYLTQCLQYYILKNSIAVHRSKYPRNMGTLLWQLNDCWPSVSWSITDYTRQPKAAWYAVREAYRDDRLPGKDSVYPRHLQLKEPGMEIMFRDSMITIRATEATKYIYLSIEGSDAVFSDNYFDLADGEEKKITVRTAMSIKEQLSKLKVKTLYEVLNKADK